MPDIHGDTASAFFNGVYSCELIGRHQASAVRLSAEFEGRAWQFGSMEALVGTASGMPEQGRKFGKRSAMVGPDGG